MFKARWQAALLIIAECLSGPVFRCPAREGGTVFNESFDSVAPPALPAGWRSSQKKSPGTNDWVSTGSTVFSTPGAVLVTNATQEQWLTSPAIGCERVKLEILQMVVRRSGTFAAVIVVEASLDSGRTFSLAIGTLPREAGNGAYQRVDLAIPDGVVGSASLMLRWCVIPDSTGTNGTFRMDDVRLTSEVVSDAQGDSLSINEIMFMPRAGEPEWIEIYNKGPADVDLRGWSISDAAIATRHVLTGVSSVLPPGGYAVVTADSSALAASRPGCVARCLQPGGFPSLNNAGDVVHLFASSGKCVDSVAYQQSWGGGKGISLERIDVESASNAPANWTSSEDTSGATPGRVNSAARRDCDLQSVRILFPGRCDDSQCDVRVEVRNVGRNAADGWSVRISDDLDRDSLAEGPEEIAVSGSHAVLEPGDSLTVDVAWSAPVPGKHVIIAETVFPDDERPANNAVIGSVTIPFPTGSVRVNEIMFDPLSGMPEYVELTNVASSPVDLDGCTLSDRPTAGGAVNCWKAWGNAFRVAHNGYLVIAADSSAPAWFPSLRSSGGSSFIDMHAHDLGLNNDGDAVIVRNSSGVVLDSVVYDLSFHTPDIPDVRGRALERINPILEGTVRSNWGTCVDASGGTPGMRNSIAVEILPTAAALAASPNPFSPDGDGTSDVVVLSYTLPLRSSLVRARVFDVCGYQIRDLANIIPAGCEGRFIWNGRDDQGRRARIGVYIVLLEAIDETGGVGFTARCVVVLAAKL